jgi:hypothetical protein
MFGLGSLLIGVLWACYQHSGQGAFTTAGYIVTFATAGIGAFQMSLVM